MLLRDLKKYQNGLALFKADLTAHRQVVRDEIISKERKEANKKKTPPTTAEKAANWWAAMGIIFLCLSAIIGGAYSLSQIQQIETEWLKWILIIVVVGVGLLMFALVCKYIWPRRDIKQFEQLFENQEI